MNEHLQSLLAYRQQGSTSALVNLLKFHPKAKIVVASARMGYHLGHAHGIDPDQILLVQTLASRLPGCTGPVLVDIPAVIHLATRSPKVAALLREAADDIESAVRHEYGWPDVHPARQRKYERDIEIVARLRAAAEQEVDG